MTVLRNSQLPLGSLHLGRRLGSTNGLRAQLKRLVDQGLIVRLDGPEQLYTLTERSDGARARLRQSLRDTKLQLKRLREEAASRPSPDLLRFGETLSGHQADIFRERTIATPSSSRTLPPAGASPANPRASPRTRCCASSVCSCNSTTLYRCLATHLQAHSGLPPADLMVVSTTTQRDEWSFGHGLATLLQPTSS